MKTIVADRKEKGIPPLKVGSSPLFDSSSSESSEAEPEKNPKKKKVISEKSKTKQKGGETSAARDEQSTITLRTPYGGGRRYSDSMSSHSSWDDCDWEIEKRRLHDIRYGRLVGPKKGTTMDVVFIS